MDPYKLPVKEIDFFRSLIGSGPEHAIKKINENFSPVDKKNPNGEWDNNRLELDLHFESFGYFYIDVNEYNIVEAIYYEGPKYSVTVKYDELHIKEKS